MHLEGAAMSPGLAQQILERLALDHAHAVALEPRDAFVQQLIAELPEARLLERVTHGDAPRVVTFALWSEEP